MSSEQRTGLLDLPLDLIFEIYGFLQVGDIFKIFKVCRVFHRIWKEERLWERLCWKVHVKEQWTTREEGRELDTWENTYKRYFTTCEKFDKVNLFDKKYKGYTYEYYLYLDKDTHDLRFNYEYVWYHDYYETWSVGDDYSGILRLGSEKKGMFVSKEEMKKLEIDGRKFLVNGQEYKLKKKKK